MVERQHWLAAIERAWRRRPIVWLVGVRRVGKTSLAQTLGTARYFDCELPRTRRLFDDPEGFLAGESGQTLILDEVHRLANPAELLKICADHHPTTRVLATGSSTLGATARFRDTLAGRKTNVWLAPLLVSEIDAFGGGGLERRMLRGGLPGFFLSDETTGTDFQEWVDDYWAKDIQELFRLERRSAFQRLLELVLSRSGGIFEATWFARACEVSRPTVTSYLSVLEATYVAHIVRPYSTHRPTEIVAAPRVYGFDTGFVCHHRGWDRLRDEDRGALLEHLALNEALVASRGGDVHYWRDKAGHEVDFVVAGKGKPPLAIECKWSAAAADATGLHAFRRQYPEGENLVVAGDVDETYTGRRRDLAIEFTGIAALGPRIERYLAPRP